MSKMIFLKLKEIDFGESRIRRDYGDLTELKESIKTNGIISPLAVRQLPDGSYRLLAGGRRYTASYELHVHALVEDHTYKENPKYFTVPCIVMDVTDELSSLVIELSENVHRKSMTWQEEVITVCNIHRRFIKERGESRYAHDSEGHSITDTAQLVGLDRTSVSKYLSIGRVGDDDNTVYDCATLSEAISHSKKRKTQAENKKIIDTIEDGTKTTDHKVLIDSLIKCYKVEDVRAFMKRNTDTPIPEDKRFDLIEIDPPYAIDLHSNKKNSSTIDYNEISVEEFLPLIEEVLTFAYNNMKDTGWLILWSALDIWGFELGNILKKIGFEGTRNVGIWNKAYGQTNNPKYYLGSAYEMFYYVRKTNLASIQQQGVPNVFSYPPLLDAEKIHPTERPIALIEKLITVFCKPASRIWVPFLGSGKTIKASFNASCVAIGSDLTQVYKDAFHVSVINHDFPNKFTDKVKNVRGINDIISN
jgi:site-specific DNA-methyltransferase (adenine-specific)